MGVTICFLGAVRAGTVCFGAVLGEWLRWIAPSAPPDSIWPLPVVCELGPEEVPLGQVARVVDGDGRTLPALVETLSTWPGGRPRLCRIRLGELPVRCRSLRLRASPPAAAPAHRWKVEQESGALRLRHPTHRVEVSASDANWTLGGPDAAWQLEWSRSLPQVDGGSGRLVPTGPLRLEGPGPEGFRLDRRFHWSLTEEPDEVLAELALNLEVSSRGRFVELGLRWTMNKPAVLTRWDLVGTLSGPSLRWLSGGGPGSRIVGPEAVLHGRYRSEGAEEDPAPPGAALRAGSWTLEWPDFRVRRPSGLTVDPSGRVTLQFAAEPVFLEAGQVLERRILLHREGQLLGQSHRPFLVPVGPRAKTLLEEGEREWLDVWIAYLSSWLQRTTALEDRGCYPGSLGAFANGEYDLGGSLLALGRLLGDGELLRIGRLVAQHSMDFDRVREPVEGWPMGLFWMHGDSHRSGRLEMGHQWVEGLSGLFEQCGDLRARSAARQLVTAVCGDNRPVHFAGPERRLAWPLRLCAEWGRFEDHAELAAAMARFADAILERQLESGFVGGDLRPVHRQERLWVNSWVSLGITVDALLRAAGWYAARDPAVAARMAAGAARLGQAIVDQVDRGHRERPWLPEVITLDPESEVVLSRQGRCRKGSAALAAAGLLELGARGLSDSAELAADLWATALEELQTPGEDDLIEFAKMARALRTLVERRSLPKERS